jgi:UDP:flavonoid glycosyltransferase YjiC (YdhE family)
MTKVLVAPALFTGHLMPHLAVAEELRRQGHTVVVHAEQDARPWLARSTCEFVPHATPLRDPFLRATTREQSIAAFTRVAAEIAPETVRLIEERNIEAALVDSIHVGAAIAAEASNIPWASLATSPWETDVGFADSPVHAVSTAAIRIPLGLDPAPGSSYQQTLSARCHMLPWPHEFSGNATPAAAAAIGPLSWSPGEAAVPDWVVSLGADRPLVVVTVPSWVVPAWEDLVAQCVATMIAALGGLPADAVLGIGDYPRPERIPSNVRVERFVPHDALVPRATALVTHGGWGSISRGLAAGIPMVVIPFGGDQPYNAQQCDQCGVGAYLPPELADPETLASAIDELIAPGATPALRAREIGARYRAPAQEAAQRVVGLVR